MSGFGWDGGIDGAKLTTGQTKQLLSYSQELIILLDQRRDWIRCVISMYPELPAILQPVIHTEHHFIKFTRDFVLKHEPKNDLWRLCFIPKPEDRPPNGNDDIGVARVAVNASSAETSCIVREKRGVRGEIRPRVTAVFSALVRRWGALSDVRAVREAIKGGIEAVQASLRDAQENLAAARAAFVERRDEILASIAAWQDEFAESAVQDSFANGRYERRVVQLPGGITMEFTTLVRDRIDWDSWLFGRRVDEDLLLD